MLLEKKVRHLRKFPSILIWLPFIIGAFSEIGSFDSNYLLGCFINIVAHFKPRDRRKGQPMKGFKFFNVEQTSETL